MMQQPPAASVGSDRTAPSAAAPTQPDVCLWLLCRVGMRLCALPVDQVSAIMRLLPSEPVAGAPAYLRGLAIIRGAPVPVVDLGLIVGGVDTRPPQRLVTTSAGPRTVALAVDEVIGVMPIAAEAAPLPPLLQGVAAETISAIGALDSELLLFLRVSRLVPEEVLARFDAERAQS